MKFARLGHLLSCKHASRLISRAQDGALPPGRLWLLRLHLAACDGCTHFSGQLKVLRAAMQRYRD